MPTLTTTKTYADGDILFESDLDQIRTDIETFLNVTKIDDDNIQDSGITASTKLLDGTITAAKLGTDSVITTKIADDAVTAAKLADSAVVTASIVDSSVTAAKLASDSVTTVKILDANVTTAKLADGAVTAAKKAALGQQISSSSGTFSTTSTSLVDVTNLTVTITTAGRPVWLGLISDGSGNTAQLVANAASDTAVGGSFEFFRDSTSISRTTMNTTNAASSTLMQITLPCSSLWHIDVPSSGTYTYKLQASATTGDTLTVQRCKLVAYEL